VRGPILALLLVGTAFAAGCGGSSSKDDTTSTTAPRAVSVADVAYPGHIYTYDRFGPLDMRDAGVVNPGYPIAVHDVTYLSPRNGRVTAYLVVPPGAGKHPAVIYLHGSGGDRLQLLVQATWMAARGAVGLVIDSAFARSGTPSGSGFEALLQQRDLEEQTIVDLRRGVDLLSSLPYVDRKRLGFVGWSSGAKSGAILSGVEHRIGSYDLIAGGSLPVSAYTRLAPQNQRDALGALLGQTDPLRWVSHSSPSAVLLQDGRKDAVVPRRALEALAMAAGQPKTVRWYPAAGHAPTSKMWHDQLRWMARRLKLGAPVVQGVKTGP
jgi:dienelactone hydrolase